MCGICGFVGTPDNRSIDGMTERLYHRGPDAKGIFSNAEVSLGSRRLSIMDPANGHQPMTNEDCSVVVVANGEIYNAGVLREQLVARGHRIVTHCDIEVLPHLYEEHGDDFVEMLNGQFAIAIWDSRRKRLVLTRDRMGIKPLFYTRQGDCTLFASEIKSLLVGMMRRPPINLEALYHYLSFKCVPSPLTIYEGVEAVRPGQQVIVQNGHLTRRQWWSLRHTACELDDIGDIENRLDELLVQSVRRRLISDVPVGACLSGGLDSSLLVAMASEQLQRPIKTFTLGYTDEFDHKLREVKAAREVARRFGTEHYEYALSREEFLEDLPTTLAAFDEPFAGVMSTYYLTKLIRCHVKVCLSGDGADELFGSYLAHRLAQPIHHLLTHGEAVVRERPELMVPFENDIDRVVDIARPQDWAWRAGLGVFTDEEKRTLLNPDYAAFADFDTTSLVRETFAGCDSDDPQNRQQNFDCRTVLPDVVLNFNDKLSMAHSVETRVPFLDHELVEFISSLPGEMKIRHGCCKWILKEVARRRLPADIVDRPKEGFVMPINAWQSDALREQIEETLMPERIAAHGFFRPERVSDLVERYYAGRTDLQYKVWALFCFQTWYERSVEPRKIEERVSPGSHQECGICVA